MRKLRVKVFHCHETGSRGLSIWAILTDGTAALRMQLVDPGIGIGNQCVGTGDAFPANTPFDLIVGVTCKTAKAKKLLEEYLEPSYPKLREKNPSLELKDFLAYDARELEFVEISK